MCITILSISLNVHYPYHARIGWRRNNKNFMKSNGYCIIIIAMKSNVIRIAVVGDQGVGKTSLVCAIISDLTSDIPKVHKKVVLPPDMCAYSKDIFTEIVDTGESADLPAEMKASDLILLVYDVSSAESIMRLKEHWLPIINQANK